MMRGNRSDADNIASVFLYCEDKMSNQGVDQKANRTDVILNLWEKIGKPEKAAMLSALFIGILTHLFMITNKLPNWDDVAVIPTTGLGPYIGRWLGDASAHWFSQWSAPGLNGVMAVVFLAIAAPFIVDLCRIRSVTGAVLAGAALVTFPSVASNMTFMYAAPTYSLSILMMVLSVWCTRSWKFGWALAIPLQVLSMAIYQAYLALEAALFLLVLLLDQADHADREVRKSLRDGLQALLVMAGGAACYLLSVKLSGYELVTYRGTNAMQAAGIGTYVEAAARAYHRILQYFVTAPESFGGGALHVFHVGIVILSAALYVLLFCKKRLWQKPGNAALYVIYLGLFPLGMGLVYLIAVGEQHASTVMIFAYCMQYLFLIALAERIDPETMAARVLSLLCSFAVFGAVFCNYENTNKAYYRTYLANQRVYAYYNRILTRLEEQEGFSYDQDVMLAGGYKPETLSQRDIDGALIDDWEGMTRESGLVTQGVRRLYIYQFLGVNLISPDNDTSESILNSTEYQTMPSYPATGSIRKISGCWVVKLSD